MSVRMSGEDFLALCVSAEAYGGIGGGKWWEYTGLGNEMLPLCADGHLTCEGTSSGFSTVKNDSVFSQGEKDAQIRIPVEEWAHRIHKMYGLQIDGQ